MKRHVFILSLLSTVAAFTANAQIQRGNVLMGGDIANFEIGLKSGARTTLLVNPKAAWFVKDNTAIGGYVTLGYSTAKGLGSDFTYGVGALARQYANGNSVPALRHTRFFVEGNVGIGGTNHSQSSGNFTTNGLGLGIGPGLAYFVTPNIGLEGLLKYNGLLGFGTTATSSELNFNFGLQIYLPGRTVRRAATNTQ